MADLLKTYNQRKYGQTSGVGSIFAPAIGLAETAIAGATSLAAALPAMMYGTYEAIKKKDPNKYTEVFEAIQSDLTYEPRSVVGKEIQKASAYLGEQGRRVADFLGEKVTGGRPESALVSGGLRMAALAAGVAVPYGRAALKRKATKTVEKVRQKERKSVLAALSAGEQLKLGAGERVVYSRNARPSTAIANVEKNAFQKDFVVPAQETALNTLEERVVKMQEGKVVSKEDFLGKTQDAAETRQRQRVEADPDTGKVIRRELAGPRQQLGKEIKESPSARPTSEDFKRVFEDSEDAKTVRALIHVDADERVKARSVKTEQTEAERISAPEKIQTVQVVDEPSYEGIRNTSIIEEPDSVRVIEIKDPFVPSIDLLPDRSPSVKAIEDRPKTDLLQKVIRDNVLPLKTKTRSAIEPKVQEVKVLRNVSDVIPPSGFERAEYLGEKQGNIVVQSKSTSGRERITGSGSTLSEALQQLQGNLDRVPTPKISRIKGIKQAKPTIEELKPDQVDNILEQMKDYDKLQSKLLFEKTQAEANKPMVLGTELNSGFNVAKGVWYTMQAAKAKLKDVLLRPEPGVKIHETKDVAARLRWRDWIASPSKVAQAQKSFRVIQGLGDRYIVDHNKLIMRNGRALDTADKFLKKTEDPHINRAALDKLLLFGDMEGKKFTSTELTEMGVDKAVQQSYQLIRRTLDVNHRLINIVRRRLGQEPIGYLQGYVSHNLKDWHILHGNKIIGSAPTFYEAVSRANAAKRGGFTDDLHVIPRGYGKSQEGFSKVADDAIKQFEDDFLSQMKFKESDIPSVSGGVSKKFKDFGNLLSRTGRSTVTNGIDQTLREYLNNSSRYIAASRFKLDSYNAFKKEFGDTIISDFPKSSVADYARNYINDITGGQVYLDKFVNDMFSESQSNFGKFVTKHFGKDVVGAFAKGGGDLANFTYIAANVSSALLNYASMIYGGAIVGHSNLWKTWVKSKSPVAAAHKAKIMEQIGVSKYSPQLEAFPSSELTKTGLLHKALYKTFSIADYDVKSNIGYAAYLKQKQEGVSHSQALKYAREVVVRSVGEISYADAPSVVRMAGKIGRPFWQLKRTLHKSIENALAFRGKEAVKFWGPFLALAGYHGIPFSQDLMNLISWATNGEVDPELAMKETLMTWAKDSEDKEGVARLVNLGSKVSQYGVGELAGIDFGRRIGLGDLTSSLGRPAFMGVVSDIWKPAIEGDWADLAFKAMPRAGEKAIQYFLARKELFKSPYDRGRLTLIDPTWGEEVAKAVGFTPVRERQAIEAGRIETQHKMVKQQEESELIDDYIKAYDKEDEEEMDDIAQEAREKRVSNFRRRVQSEYRRKAEGKTAAVKRLAGKKRRQEVEAYAP